jgi:predicted DsbA family dithiol-disulfide isomerase
VGIDRVRKEYDITLRWLAFPLHPEVPENGMTMEELFAGRGYDIPRLAQSIRRLADELGLPMGERRMTFNTRLSQELAKYAESEGRGDEMHRALFRAYFVDDRNIGTIHILADIAGSIGLNRDAAVKVLSNKTFTQVVDDDWTRAHIQGITAVPTFLIGPERAVGMQSYENLARMVGRYAARKT